MLSSVTQHPDIIIKSEIENLAFFLIRKIRKSNISPKAFNPSEILSKI